MSEKAAQQLAARLISSKWLPRTDEQVVRLITDEEFRDDVLCRLKACGLTLLENPFSEYVAVGLADDAEQAVMGHDTGYLSNTYGLDRDAIALLVILWALLIIPKRQRQIEAVNAEAEGEQFEFFPSPQLMAVDAVDKPAVKKDALVTDFGQLLGKKTRMERNLGQLSRLGFIIQSQRTIMEGPLLDLSLDYKQMASRIIEGALGDLLKDQSEQMEEESHV